MMSRFSQRILGTITLGGSYVGMVVIAAEMMHISNTLAMLLYAAFLTLYAWGVWCGIRLFENHPSGARMGFWFWLLQVPVLSSPIFGYFFAAGGYITFILQPSNWGYHFNFHFGSAFNVSLVESHQPFYVGVNLFALFIALWLATKRRG